MADTGESRNLMSDVRKIYATVKLQHPIGLAQATLYLLSVVFGFTVAVPVGITLRNFNGMCILYAEVVWDNQYIYPWADSSCDLVLYMTVAGCIVYATLMAIFTLLAVLPKTMEKQDKVGMIQAYNTRFLIKNMNPVMAVINAVIFCLVMICAIMVTVGFAWFCKDLEKSMRVQLNDDSFTCYNAQDLDWNKLIVVGGSTSGANGSNFHICLTIAMIGAWALFIIWFLQLALNLSQCCQGVSCRKADEKQKMNKSMSIALRRSRMATPSGTPGHMTPRGYGPPPPHMVAHAQIGPNPQVMLHPAPHSSKA